MAIQGYITVREAARLKGVDAQTIRRWIHAGVLSAVRVGSSYLVLQGDLEKVQPSARGRPRGQNVREIIREELERLLAERASSG